MPAIQVDKLTRRFGPIAALNNVSFSVAAGEMVALIGASGSGKSTLIRQISGLDRASDADSAVSIFNRSMQSKGRLTGEARAIRRDVGVVFQQFNLVGRLSVLTNVLIGCLGRVSRLRGTLGWFPREERNAALAAMTRMGIGEKAIQRASTLSGGQQQRAAIARALLQRARILLADEPIASLDPASAKRVMEALAEVNRADGITVVVSLHQVQYARLYCPRTIALRAGEIVFDGASAKLTDEFLKKLYGEDSEELVLPDSTPARESARRPVPAFLPA